MKVVGGLALCASVVVAGRCCGPEVLEDALTFRLAKGGGFAVKFTK